jgi:putative ABC transport system substrate-binding protein
VSSLSHPGGNVTGVYQFTAGLESKRLGLLHEMAPKAGVVGVLVNPNYAAAESQLRDVQDSAAHLGLQLIIVRANTENEFAPRSRRSSRSVAVRSWFVLPHSSIAVANSWWS